MLDVYAGSRALHQLKIEGFKPEQFGTVLGASGGPKWFVLAGIDRVMVSEFLAGTEETIDFVGSSAGAFRFGCLTQKDPVAAINSLAKHYSETVYSDKPTVAEISEKAVRLINTILPESAQQEVLTNPNRKAHFIVARCKNAVAYENQALQMLGLGLSAGANIFSRRLLNLFYERFVFSVPERKLQFNDPSHLETAVVNLSKNNLIDALLASGAIPGILKGIENIKGAAPGMYRDGGVTDYHFDLNFTQGNKLVLFPHFYSRPIPGWFDKSLKWRHPHRSSFENVVMVVPSEEFIATLPYCKIPDRHDFTKMTAEQRLPYWKTVLSETDRLGEAFMALTNHSKLMEVIKPLPFKTS